MRRRDSLVGEGPGIEGVVLGADADAGFRVQGPGSRVQGPGLRVEGAGFRVQGAGFRVQGLNTKRNLVGGTVWWGSDLGSRE
jgi:hypothetical protein